MSVSDKPLWVSLPTPGFLVDAEDRITAINPAAEGFLNSSDRAVSGMALWKVLTVETTLQTAFERARTGGTSLLVNDVDVGVALRAKAPGNTRAPVQCNLQIAPMTGQDGVMIILLSPRDLPGQMAQNRSVKSAGRSAIGMAEMLAHEIKNPLAGITGAAQLLEMGLDPDQHELTQLIVSESRRIVALLDRVEQFGNVGAPNFRRINVHDVLARARRSAQLGLAADMTILEDYDPSLPEAQADPDMLLQVFQNLIKNAGEAAGAPGGTIRLHTYFDPSLRIHGADGAEHKLPLQIEVIDDGPGLPEAIAADVFDPFVSGRENGTGLGLALAARIITAHEGWISVKSHPGKTVFRISLPIARADKETPREVN
ncbi:ATP-binding protein [Roseovarius aestuarii]|nr:ATP-binding protein [Roseovarius aestuarii]